MKEDRKKWKGWQPIGIKALGKKTVTREKDKDTKEDTAICDWAAWQSQRMSSFGNISQYFWVFHRAEVSFSWTGLHIEDEEKIEEIFQALCSWFTPWTCLYQTLDKTYVYTSKKFRITSFLLVHEKYFTSLYTGFF